mgnify:CR=1 FL=1|tara:strand:- start:3233 stop:3556 length:324 start_codon:yes stop_codon:yes gene_type:complete
MKSILTIFLKKKTAFIAGSLFIMFMILSYQAGLKAGFVPFEIQCKEPVLYLETCKDEIEEQNKAFIQRITECKSNCKIDICKPICLKKVEEAMNNYHKLNELLECND